MFILRLLRECGICEPEDCWSFAERISSISFFCIIVTELHNIDIWAISSLLENELVFRNIPVCNFLDQRLFKNHLTFVSPDLEKIVVFSITSVGLSDFLVHKLDEDGTKLTFLVELATCDNLVEFLERHFEHDLVHESSRISQLSVQTFKLVIFMNLYLFGVGLVRKIVCALHLLLVLPYAHLLEV